MACYLRKTLVKKKDLQPTLITTMAVGHKSVLKKRQADSALGSGFDPGVTSVFSAYALKHYFDEIHYIDI